MLRKMTFWLSVLILLSSQSCLVMENPYPAMAPGSWRAVLQIDPSYISPNKKGEPLPEKLNLQFEEVTRGQLPFNFEVSYMEGETFVIDLINGTERIRIPADQIYFGRDLATAKDTVRINFPLYESYLVGLYEEDTFEGKYVVSSRQNYEIPFLAKHGESYRFTQLRKEPMMDVSGSWAVQFGLDTEEPFPGVGEFVQNGNALTGTFRIETGDYRFLEGSIQDNKIYLSCFDGSHAFLFEAKILPDSTMIGSFRSGKHYQTTWEAVRTDTPALTSPYELTRVQDTTTAIDFAFPDPNGRMVSLQDPALAGKAKIVQIMGTWCPNCRDETRFLVDYLQENPSDDLAVLAVAFEKHRDLQAAGPLLKKYQEKMKIPYPILYGGYYQKAEASRQLPMLSEIISYPTLLFLDRENRVVKVHTGFDGPATSRYADFTQEFHEIVEGLIN